jgi:pimeloyl-ACP methyl ester carboxylesterase
MRLGDGASQAARDWQQTGRFVHVNGHDVFVHQRGSGADILFIHGFPTSCFDWSKVIGHLAARFQCVALDLIGFGLSDKPEAWSYSLFQQADVVEGLLGKVGCREVHVVSHDMGTSVHTELLARKAEGRLSFTIPSSTFLNGSIIKGMAALTPFQKMLENPATLGQAAEIVEALPQNYASRLRHLMGRPEALSESDADLVTELLVHDSGYRRIPNVYSYVRERYLHQNRWLSALRNESSPVQIVWGDKDPVAHIGMGRALHDLAPHARYSEAEGIGHFLPIEAPELVAARVEQFIHNQG